MIWFTADTHFGHEKILTHMPERQMLQDMDGTLIDEINGRVGRNDELWMLGDFCWAASRAGHYRQRIKCRKVHVLRGNHDSSSLRSHVSTMELMAIKRFGDQLFHLCHYPLRDWAHMYYGGRHLHGHCHGRLSRLPGSLDVGVDNARKVLGAWRPFSLDDVLDLTNDGILPTLQ